MVAAAAGTAPRGTVGTVGLGVLDAQGLRELACHPLDHGLGELLRQCLPAPASVPEIELLRTKYKPGRALTASYRTDRSTAARWLAVSWALGPKDPSPTGTPDVAVIEAEARRRGLMAPFSRLAARESTPAVSLLVSPADPTMAHLVRLHDPSYLDDLLHRLAGAPAVRRGRAVGITVVRYRPGQRHVLRVDLDDGSRVGSAFVKTDRDDCGERAVTFARVLGPQLAAACPGASLCSPLGYAASDRASVWDGSPGRSLSQEVATGARSPQVVALFGRALRFLHDSDATAALPPIRPADGDAAAPRGVRAEVASTLRACEHLDALVPGAGAAVAAVAARVLHELAQLPEDEPRITHGDAKCDNVVTDGRGVTVLDLDRVTWGDPAVDLGKLLADLRWWCTRAGRDPASVTDALVAGYGPCHPARWARARLLAVLFQCKLTARRAPLHEAGWVSRVGRGVAAATEQGAKGWP